MNLQDPVSIFKHQDIFTLNRSHHLQLFYGVPILKKERLRKIHVIGFFFISCRPVTYLLRTRMFLYEFCIKLLKQYLLGGPQRAASESLSGPDNFPTRG